MRIWATTTPSAHTNLPQSAILPPKSTLHGPEPKPTGASSLQNPPSMSANAPLMPIESKTCMYANAGMRPPLCALDRFLMPPMPVFFLSPSLHDYQAHDTRTPQSTPVHTGCDQGLLWRGASGFGRSRAVQFTAAQHDELGPRAPGSCSCNRPCCLPLQPGTGTWC